MRLRSFGIVALLGLTVLAFSSLPASAKEKVSSITDLPVRTYPTEVAPSAMIDDPVLMDALRTAVRLDIEAIFEDYEIEDSSTLKRFYAVLSNIALFEGRDDAAKKYWEKVRELEDKDATRLMIGLRGTALVAARKAGKPGGDSYNAAYAATYASLIEPLPWDVVQDRIEGSKGSLELRSENLLRGLIVSVIDPVVAETGELSDEMAESLLNRQMTLRDFMELREIEIAILQKRIDANRVEKEDIWPARSITLKADEGFEPVVVGVWDSGVDAGVFGEQMWTNQSELYNGLDDDGNGFVDDMHGIAFNMFGAPHPDLLHPHGDMTGKVESSMSFMKGLTDLQAANDSPEASELKAHIGSLEPTEVKGFISALGFTGLYAHGTHVAGIFTEGNPFARVLCARISFDYHPKPAPIQLESAKAHAESYARTAEYFKDAGVRVVNMSWGWTFAEIEHGLEANGIGATADERRTMAEEIFGTLDRGLHAAIASAPDILFVIAAGNDDSDVAFDRVIPSVYELDNIMVVGAVDQAGERTSFTSMGKNVVIYANGFEVMSFVPGGKRMAMSGTSMASPNAANLATKLITIDPSLTPSAVVALIEGGADELEDQAGLKLLNPAASLALLEADRASR